MTVHIQRYILVTVLVALGGCHSGLVAERPAVTAKSKPKLTVENTVESRVKEPVYIDLGPIETADVNTVPITPLAPPVTVAPVTRDSVPVIEREISPAEAATIEQVSSYSDGTSESFVEQPSGTLNDRCDPSFWGGVRPPAHLGCDGLALHSEKKTRYEALVPGTYVRLTSKPETKLRDSSLIARKVGEFGIDVPDNTFGAVLASIGGSVYSPQGAVLEEAEDGATSDVPEEGAGLPGFVLLPGS